MTANERDDTLNQDMARLPASSPEVPDDAAWAINMFAGVLALTAFACVDAWLVHLTGLRLALLVVAVTVIAERAADPRAALCSPRVRHGHRLPAEPRR